MAISPETLTQMKEGSEAEQRRRLDAFVALGPSDTLVAETNMFWCSYMIPTSAKLEILDDLIKKAGGNPAENNVNPEA